MITSQVIVCGGGPTGYTAAIAAARAGKSVTLLAPPVSSPPGRTVALLDGSVRFLRSLDAWDPLQFEAAPLRGIRLIDDTQSLIRAPEVTFHAPEIGLKAFGYNVAYNDIVRALARVATGIPEIEVITETASVVSFQEDDVRMTTAGGANISAELVVAADGARSLVRKSADISVQDWQYHQSALITTLTVERPHCGISTEFHNRAGPFTLVPLAGNRMSLVWLMEPDRASALAGMAEQDFAVSVETQAQSIHGRMTADTGRFIIPLKGLRADRFSGHRVMLVGEAAHVLPPIGAQGLNLGLRDVEALARIVARSGDCGSKAATRFYQASREVDIQSRTIAVDLVNRSLLTSFLPAHLLRNGGIAVASAIPALRRLVMRSGLSGLSMAI